MNSKILAVGLTLSIAAVSGWMTYELLTSRTNRMLGRFGCEMHCEPGKTYGSAQTPCDVCGMKLRPVADLPYALGVSTNPVPPSVGVSSRLVVRALDQTAMPIRSLRALDDAAGSQIRIFIAPEDLSILHTDTPTRSSDGTFTTRFTHDRPGKYTLWAEFDPAAAGGPVNAQWTYLVDPSGTPADQAPPVPPMSTGELADTTDEVLTLDHRTIRIRCNGPRARAGEPTLIRAATETTTPNSAPADPPDLLVALAADGRWMLSVPPLDAEAPEYQTAAARAADYGNGQPTDTLFQLRYPAAGFYRVFLVWNPGSPADAPTFAGFWQQVAPGEIDSGPPSASELPGHQHHAPGHPAADAKGQSH